MEKRRSAARVRKPRPESSPVFEDFPMLEDEEFDFDLPCISTSSGSPCEEDHQVSGDQEVFFGKVGLMEKCAAKVAEDEEGPATYTEPVALSALEFAEIFVEAQKVASLISSQSKMSKTICLGPQVAARLTFTDESESPRRGHKRKGTFTLDINDEEGETELSKKGAHEQMGSLPLNKAIPPVKNPGHERKGTFNLDSPSIEEVAEISIPVVRQPEIPKPCAAPGASVEGSKLQRNAIQRRGLRAPSGRIGPGGAVPRARAKPTATTTATDTLKRPAPTSSENKEPPKRLSRGLGRPALVKPLLQRPASGLKPPERKSLPALTGTSTAPVTTKPVIASTWQEPSLLKGPITKRQLMKPGQLQIRGPGLKQPTAVKGPIKATEQSKLKAPIKATESSKIKAPETRLPLTSHVNGVAEKPRQVKRAASSIHRSLQVTPVKRDKNVQPKRLMAGPRNKDLKSPPRKSSDSSSVSGSPTSTPKHRPLLPTPGRTFSGPRRSYASVSSTGSAVSSNDSAVSSASSAMSFGSVDLMASPQLKDKSTRRSIASPQTRSQTSPMRRRSAAVGGLKPLSSRSTSSRKQPALAPRTKSTKMKRYSVA